ELERPTGLSKQDALELVRGVVRFFRNFQNERGAIIDPYTEAERQYSTPAYALCGAVLLHAGTKDNPWLAQSTLKAFDWALTSLVEGRPADNHGDFFTVKLMLALPLLKPFADASQWARWEDLLRRLNPDRSYRDILRYKKTEARIHNWNLVAISGEYLRSRAGYSDGAFVRRYVPIQLTRFTEHGMYVDPHNPMAYDVFSRYHVAIMLAHGYDGVGAKALRQAQLRGGWTALFLQSPAGEVPCGGRSAHHQWNEAAQTATFEMIASELWKKGDRLAARAFKRGARLGLASLKRWVRPTGEFWIVKNRAEPWKRWGFEGYSYHSQYNLLAASMLAVAHLAADDSIPEGVAPADVGGYVLTLDDGRREDFEAPGFHKTVARAGKLYVLVEHAGNHRYNPTGVLRLHGPFLRGLSDGSVNATHYAKRWNFDRDRWGTAAVAPVWKARDGAVMALAWVQEKALLDAWKVQVEHAEPDAARWIERIRVPEGPTVERRYEIRGPVLRITERLLDWPGPIGVQWPLWTSDGLNLAGGTLRLADGSLRDLDDLRSGTFRGVVREASFSLDGAQQVYRLRSPNSARAETWGEQPFRNGVLQCLTVWSDGPEISYEVELWPSEG
ncbi:MAG: hypothetical protein GXO73_10350, partial [Calditrichaeota bacterium]|nr:hypothetical protein [Calditrichota bacterium]